MLFPLFPAGVINLRPHLRDVAGDLFAQFRRRGEFLFVPQFPANFNFQFLAIKIARKIQQMRLYSQAAARSQRQSGAGRC